MNARDNIRPKSIRLAILMALADGEITIIDDLLTRTGEQRNKLVSNIGAAAIDGLVKRMRDDVTGLAAYQITATGRQYLAKFGDGKKSEPAQTKPLEPAVPVVEPVVREDRTDEPATPKTEKLAPQPSQTEIIAQKDVEIASMSRRLRDAFADVDRLNKELEEAKASLELTRMARKVEPVGYVIQRPAKPLVRVTKAERAKERALAFARGGKRAQVFALVAVGTAVPGSEWRE
jgi:hypothetical protein